MFDINNKPIMVGCYIKFQIKKSFFSKQYETIYGYVIHSFIPYNNTLFKKSYCIAETFMDSKFKRKIYDKHKPLIVTFNDLNWHIQDTINNKKIYAIENFGYDPYQS